MWMVLIFECSIRSGTLSNVVCIPVKWILDDSLFSMNRVSINNNLPPTVYPTIIPHALIYVILLRHPNSLTAHAFTRKKKILFWFVQDFIANPTHADSLIRSYSTDIAHDDRASMRRAVDPVPLLTSSSFRLDLPDRSSSKYYIREASQSSVRTDSSPRTRDNGYVNAFSKIRRRMHRISDGVVF